ncbi:ATP-binding protein [Brachybacterium hainanense]|uniref:ATP-binding protein n=1 Tax=Brachybacterium hainanense TaxID=1541174 RepID=A0ABV6RA10_9MICO
MRTPLNSPFSPGSDSVPEVWAGRLTHLDDWRSVVRPRRLAGLPERGRTILGEAGLGKSSLVRRLASEAAALGDWITPQLRIPLGADPLKPVAAALLELARQAGLPASREQRIGSLLERVETVAAAGLSLSMRAKDGPEPYSALSDLILEIGREAARRGDVLVMIHIDEMQNVTRGDALSQLLIALGDSLAHEEEVEVPGGGRLLRTLPIAVYLTGLPEFADMAGARKGATFARRFQTTTLAAIADDDLAAALQPFVLPGWPVSGPAGLPGRVRMTPQARDAIIERCCGEPFLFQLAGERAWYAGTGDLITREDVAEGWRSAEGEAESHVVRILERLPAREREFVEAMASLAPQERRLTRIAEAAGLSAAAKAGPTTQRLDTQRGIIRRGSPYTFRHRAVEAYLATDWPAVA